MHTPDSTPRPLRWALLPAALLSAASLCLAPSPAAATVPSSMHVEGFLRSAGGAGISDGSYDLTVSLYAAKSGGSALWSDSFAKVPVTGGRFSLVLGASKPLPPAVLAKTQQAWLSIQVAGDPELPRMAIDAKAYALVAAVADDLACTGCVPVSAMKFDADLDLGAHGLKAGSVTAADIQAGTVNAQQLVGDGSKLTGVHVPPATCPKGQAVKGIAADGKLLCVPIGVTLPKDAIDEVSNGLIFNQFVDKVASTKTPVSIPDNNPIGVADLIVVPDLGLAQKLTVSVHITNSDLSKLKVTLYDAKNTPYSLWEESGPGKVLKKTFPTPDKTLSGDLTTWEGKNPKGTWRLRVIDTEFKNNGMDGAIESWSINIQTLSNQKIQLKGDGYVTGDLLAAGSLKLGSTQAACTPALAGQMRYDAGQMRWCDGAVWTALNHGGRSLYRWQVWGDYGSGGWYAADNASLFGGIKPSKWGDGAGRAYQLSSSSEVLRTFFNRRGPPLAAGMKNALVYAEEWNYASTSTDSQHVGVLFRVRNSTPADLQWKVYWYRTAYAGWSERASISVNGVNIWDGGGSDYSASSGSSHTLTIPKNRTSTVIFIAGSSPQSNYMRATHLSFYNNSLALPPGLSFVDDLDTKPNGWNN